MSTVARPPPALQQTGTDAHGAPEFTSLAGVFARASAFDGADPHAASPHRHHHSSNSGPTAVRHIDALSAGSCDYLRIAALADAAANHNTNPSSAASPGALRGTQLQVVRDFIHAQGDRVIHFSGECHELLASLPVRRLIIVTEKALYRIPQSTVDTGIFFDCRVELDRLSQAIAVDGGAVAGGGAQVEVFERSKRTGEVTLAMTLSFGVDGASRRKAFLLSLCVVCPTLPVLQKKLIVPPSHDGDADPSPAASATRPTDPTSPGKRDAAQRSTTLHSVTASVQAKFVPRAQARLASKDGAAGTPQRSSSDGGGEFSAAKHLPFAQGGVGASPTMAAPEISEDAFEKARVALREALEDNAAVASSDFDVDRARARPKEEDVTRMLEREKIKALVLSREAKIVQNIEFKLKYPQKPPTRVAPGVEFDKAHEEQRTLPDGFTDGELLGPALHPLWLQWKKSGGLLAPDGTPSDDWNLYDSNDLIESLKAREEALFGVVGKKGMRRLQQMRELVGREKQMFQNKKNAIMRRASSHRDAAAADGDDDQLSGDYSVQRSDAPSGGGGGGSVGRSPASRRGTAGGGRSPVTRPVPFRLSQSPMTTRKGRMIDSATLVAEMKQNFERHLQVMHELRKEQLARELARVND